MNQGFLEGRFRKKKRGKKYRFNVTLDYLMKTQQSFLYLKKEPNILVNIFNYYLHCLHCRMLFSADVTGDSIMLLGKAHPQPSALADYENQDGPPPSSIGTDSFLLHHPNSVGTPIHAVCFTVQ
jgi:hypothetical protein